jgi:hypothetical protein
MSKKKYYFVECSDWSLFISAQDAMSAAAKSLSKMLQARGSKLNLSYTMIIQQIKPVKKEIEFLYVPKVLLEIGEDELAQTLDQMCKNTSRG